MADSSIPDDLGLTPPAFVGPIAPPPTTQSFLPHPNLAQKLAPLGVMLASLIGGKGMTGAASGFSQGQRISDQQDLQKAELSQHDAMQQQAFQQHQMERQRALDEERNQRLMAAVETVRKQAATLKTKAQYDQMIDGYAATFMRAGYRVTPNQLRVQVPFYVKEAPDLARAYLKTFFSQEFNQKQLEANPDKVLADIRPIDLNGDGEPEHKTLAELMRLAGQEPVTDPKTGKVIGINDTTKGGPIDQQLLQAKKARYLAENNHEATGKALEKLILESKQQLSEVGRKPDEPNDVVNLSPAGLDAAAMQYAKTGQLPPMGMSKQSAGVRSKIINRAAEKYGANGQPLDVAGNKATFTANQGALTDVTKRSTMTDVAAKTASDNLNLALAQSGEVTRTGSKLANRYLQWAQGQLSPAEGLTKFETYVYTAAREYAKVTSGGAASAQGLTDAAAREAEKLLNTAQSPRAFAAAVQAMRDDMANVQKNYQAQVANMRGQMRGSGGQTQAPTDVAAPETGWTDVGGGILIRPKKP